MLSSAGIVSVLTILPTLASEYSAKELAGLMTTCLFGASTVYMTGKSSLDENPRTMQ
jgi:hypothetical protein